MQQERPGALHTGALAAAGDHEGCYSASLQLVSDNTTRDATAAKGNDVGCFHATTAMSAPPISMSYYITRPRTRCRVAALAKLQD